MDRRRHPEKYAHEVKPPPGPLRRLVGKLVGKLRGQEKPAPKVRSLTDVRRFGSWSCLNAMILMKLLAKKLEMT